MSGRRRRTIASRRELFEEAAAIIALEYAEALALDEVAQRLFSSPRQLQRAFAEAGQTSFRTHLRWVRMERAGELLRCGSLRISEVAVAVGYRQPAQFAKAFRHHHGYSPSAVRDAAIVNGLSRRSPRGSTPG
jgi:AraC family transcriptional regulator of adaptative response / methylphosphotriester-DNA alkyltransferase methyltransferase